MEKIKLGILGTSEIAFRRFLPALAKCSDIEYIGVASRDIAKTETFVKAYGGKGYGSYEELLEDETIDAVYIPLPPALHFDWAKKALEKGKHVFLEKPFTTKLEDTKELINIAKSKNLALHENYMFQYHSQIDAAKDFIADDKYGKLRQLRIAFGFPRRSEGDFRYNKELGGGALLDCGGYTIKLASILLGDKATIKTSTLVGEDSQVDIYGSVTLSNEKDMTCQASFGMDNEYKCELEIWKSRGTAVFPRIFTAPTEFNPQMIVVKDNEERTILLSQDDQFLNSIRKFVKCMKFDEQRLDNYREILFQGMLVNDVGRVR